MFASAKIVSPLVICASFLLLALTACGGGGGSDSGSDGSPGMGTQHEVTVPATDRTRAYNLYLPDDADEASSLPLVLLFHGGFGRPQTILASTDMKAKADEEGFAIATLKARNGVWNVGHEGDDGGDDVAFTEAVITRLADTENIDLDRVYAAGFSMGGAMVYRLACELSDRIAAVGVVSGYSSQETQALLSGQAYPCQRSDLTHPMPVLHIHGGADQCVKYNGGQGEGFNTQTRRTSIPDTIASWASRNQCNDQSTPASDPPVGVSCNTRDECDAGSAVRLCTIENQGHVWPGNAQYLPRIKDQCGGEQTGAVDATDRFWNFVKGYRLNELSN